MKKDPIQNELRELLSRLPDTPVASNFTARVLAAIDHEEAQAAQLRSWTLNWRRLWPRVAMVAAILIVAAVGLQRYETDSQRIALAKNVALLAAAQPPPSVDVLVNLDTIQRMSRPAHADGELLAVLQ
jgi:negative regulator of sigma E activity